MISRLGNSCSTARRHEHEEVVGEMEGLSLEYTWESHMKNFFTQFLFTTRCVSYMASKKRRASLVVDNSLILFENRLITYVV